MERSRTRECGSGSDIRPSRCKVSNGNEAENVAVAIFSFLHNAIFEVMWQWQREHVRGS